MSISSNFRTRSKYYFDSKKLTSETRTNGFSESPLDWRRNPTWPACDVSAGDEAFKALIAVFPGDYITNYNYFETYANAGGTIDWGDSSSTETLIDGVEHGHSYSYNDSALDNTDGPVTFTASTNTVNRTNHGYENGSLVRFYNIQTTTGITEDEDCYVINATANTFQVSATPGGSAITLTNDGSATLLPYKIATLHVQATDLLTGLRWTSQPSGSNAPPWGSAWNYYNFGFLDIAVAGSGFYAFVGLGSSSQSNNKQFQNLERFRFIETTHNQASGLSLNYGFANLPNLREVHIDPETRITDMYSAFTNCYNLQRIYGLGENTSTCTNMSWMFHFCRTLKEIPPLNLSSCTNLSYAFRSCLNVESFPPIIAPNCSNASFMLADNPRLEYLPAIRLNTTGTVIGQSMFRNNYALKELVELPGVSFSTADYMIASCFNTKSIPNYDFSSCTNIKGLFNGCYSLKEIPDTLDFSSATDVSYSFSTCRSLKYIPPLDFSSATLSENTFANCESVESIGTITTSSSLTSVRYMFYFCYALQNLPKLTNTSNVTNWQSFVGYCTHLKKIPVLDMSSATEVRYMFQRCHSLRSLPAMDWGNITTISTSSSQGPFYLCSLERIDITGIKASITVAIQQLSADALDDIYTNLATVTGKTIVVTGNYGTASDDPSIATAKGWTVTG